MVVLVCGDREWNSYKPIYSRLRDLPPGTIIVHGDCRGADKMSGFVAKQYGFEVIPVPADWDKFGKAAGPIRNQKMLDEHKVDLVLAFHNDIASSRGTKDMITRADKAGIAFEIITDADHRGPRTYE